MPAATRRIDRKSAASFTTMLDGDRQREEFVARWRHVGVHVVETRHAYRCPFHHDRHPSLSVDVATCRWFCHACDVGGGLVALRDKLGVPQPERQPDPATVFRRFGKLVVAADIDTFQAHVDAEVTGGHNQSRWALLMAAARIFRRLGRTEGVSISVPMLVEESGLCRATVQRQMKWVVAEAWLVRDAEPTVEVNAAGDVRQLATVWSLPTCKLRPLPSGSRPIPTGGLTSHVAHDAFAGRALGKNALRVLDLAVAGYDADTIARLLGFHRTTVARHLARLADHGLMTGRRPARSQLDWTAHVFGTAGRAMRLRRKHREDRVRRRQVLGSIVLNARWAGKPLPASWKGAA